MTRRRLLYAVLVLAAAGVGVGVWWLAQPSPLDRVRADLDAADPGWRFADLRAARLADPPPPAENAVFAAAAAGTLVPAEFVAWKAAADADPDGWLGGLPTNRKPADPGGVAAWKAAGEAVASARRVKDMPRGSPNVTIAADPFQTLLPYLDGCNRAAALLRVDAVRSAAGGDATGAADAVRAILNIGRGVGREPFFVSYLVRTAQSLTAADALVRVLAQAELPADALAAAHAGLAEAADPGLLASGLRDWRAGADLELSAIAAGDADLQFAQQAGIQGRRPALTQPERWRYRMWVRHDHAAVLRQLTGLIEVARRPAHEWAEAAEAVPLPPDDDRHLFAYGHAVHARKVVVGAVRHQAVLRTAVLLVGCERFRLRHGRWPGSADELPADLRPAVTTDPFTGRPLLVRRLADGLAVYSVGPDGQDDGGLFSRFPADPPRQDVGWRLWDAPARGRP